MLSYMRFLRISEWERKITSNKYLGNVHTYLALVMQIYLQDLLKHVAQYYVQHCPTRSRLKEIQIVILQMPAKRVRQSDFYSNMFGEGKTASKKTKGYEGYFIYCSLVLNIVDSWKTQSSLNSLI